MAGSGSFSAVGGIEGSEFLSIHGESQARRAHNHFRLIALDAIRGVCVPGLRAVYPFRLAAQTSNGGRAGRDSHCHHQPRGDARLRFQQPGIVELPADVRAGHSEPASLQRQSYIPDSTCRRSRPEHYYHRGDERCCHPGRHLSNYGNGYKPRRHHRKRCPVSERLGFDRGLYALGVADDRDSKPHSRWKRSHHHGERNPNR